MCGHYVRGHLLRENYRQGGKVKHRTIANLSHGNEVEIEAIRLALKHKEDLAAVIDAAGWKWPCERFDFHARS